MKAPITIAVLALHIALITTILAQQGCNSTEESATVNPDLAAPSLAEANKPAPAPLPEGSPSLRAEPTRPAVPAPEAEAKPVEVAQSDTPIEEPKKIEKPAEPEPDPALQDKAQTAISQNGSAASEPSAQASTYIVKKNDNLSKIAARHGVSLNDLMLANGLNRKSVIKVGQKLEIPSAGSPAQAPKKAEAENAEAAPGGAETIYVVKKGDSISKIAIKHRTSIRAIMDANGMKKTVIREGQKLKIPAPAAQKAAAQKSKKYEGKLTHTVAKGEYLGGIAAKYKISLTELMDKNSIIDPRKIQVGQILVIKDLEPAAEAEAPKAEASASAPSAPSAQPAQPLETAAPAAPASNTTDIAEPSTQNTQDL